jgi:acyl-CoA reductase-like NAD-dependent aldehyde dehydrogenase
MDTSSYTKLSDIPVIVANARSSFNSKVSLPLSWRIEQLKGLRKFMLDNMEEIFLCIKNDLGRSKTEALIGEHLLCVTECDDAIANLSSWASIRHVETNLANLPAGSSIQYQPKGVVLVASPWNFPFMLSICTVIPALAAGNIVILKPSEVSEHSSRFLASALPRYLDPRAVSFVLGGVAETSLLLKERFDHIIFTGSPSVGKIFMRAAADHLTPCTLELGGKNPVIVDASANLDLAAKSIIWGRCLNTGQQCLSPEYILVDKKVEQELLIKMMAAITSFYGENVEESPDLGRIINDSHFKRVKNLLKDHGGKVITGGEMNASTRFCSPTIITNPSQDSLLMNDECFAPILAVIGVDSVKEGVEKWINTREKPLALYLFSSSSKVIDWVKKNTTSGGLTVNHCVVHITNGRLPFGGIGNSGMGSYHGEIGFQELSHKRSTIEFSSIIPNIPLFAVKPPFSGKFSILKMLLYLPGFLPSPGIKNILIVGLSCACGVLVAKLYNKF